MATDRARVVPLGVAGLLLAALFLVCYAVQVLYVSAPAAVRDGLKVTLRCTWAVFITDYVARLLLAVHKVRFVLRTPFDLAVIALPLMRSVQHRVALHTTGATALIGLTASLAVLDAERAATITTFQDAAWWTLTTITTVGFGDRYPITSETTGPMCSRIRTWSMPSSGGVNCGKRSMPSGRRVRAFQRPVGKRSLTDPRGCGRTGVCVTHSRAWPMCRGGS